MKENEYPLLKIAYRIGQKVAQYVLEGNVDTLRARGPDLGYGDGFLFPATKLSLCPHRCGVHRKVRAQKNRVQCVQARARYPERSKPCVKHLISG